MPITAKLSREFHEKFEKFGEELRGWHSARPIMSQREPGGGNQISANEGRSYPFRYDYHDEAETCRNGLGPNGREGVATGGFCYTLTLTCH